MKLELKHLASYLPYKLKYKFESEDFFHEVIGLDITNNPIKLISPFGDFGSCEINVGKPILFPLSQFVKFTFSEEVEECLLNYSADFILNQTNRLPYFINDMWAIGNYGIPNDIYLRALKDRYFQIVAGR